MSIDDWQERYRSREFHDSGAIPLLQQTCASLQPGRALDLACGAGRNALWLAERQWHVTAVDSSYAAIQLLEDRAAARGIEIDTHVANLETHEFEIAANTWDLIVVSLYLQRDLFEPIRLGLVQGGIALLVVHLADPDRRSQFSLQPGELPQYFAGYTVLHNHEGTPTGSAGGRRVAEIVIRRP